MAEKTPPSKTNGEVEKLRKELEECREECQGYLDGWKRAKADAENDRKSRATRAAEEHRSMKRAFVATVLPILDSANAALAHSSGGNVSSGLEQIKVQIESTLAQHGATVVDPTGEIFNPHEHEAIGERTVAEDQQEGVIVEVARVGVVIDGTVIRPAMVYVGKH